MKMKPGELEARLNEMADRWDLDAEALASPLDEIQPTKANKIRAIAAGFRDIAAQQFGPNAVPVLPRRRRFA